MQTKTSSFHITSFLKAFVAALALSASAGGAFGEASESGQAVVGLQPTLEAVGETIEVLDAAAADEFPGGAYDAVAASPVDFSGLVTRSRTATHSYAVQPGAAVTIVNQFGSIEVDAWDLDLVRVEAVMKAGGESEAGVERLLEALRIDRQADDASLRFETIYPVSTVESRAAMETTYAVSVPRDAVLATRNVFGDTIIRGVRGSISVEARFGTVELDDIGGPVRVLAKGGFPLRARGLGAGGTFTLRNTAAEFSGISGTLKVAAYLGSIVLRDVAADAAVDVAAENTPITFRVDGTAPSRIDATTFFGTISSDIPLEQRATGEVVRATTGAGETSGQIALQTSFADIAIRSKAAALQSPGRTPGEGGAVQDTLTCTRRIAEGTAVRVGASIPGDVHIEGIDEDNVYMSATKVVRLRSNAVARDALDALHMTAEENGNALTIRTWADADPAALGCVSYRVDVTVRCPRTSSLDVEACDGQVAISGIGEAVDVHLAKGAMVVEHVKGALTLLNRDGDIEVADCAGPVGIESSQGTVGIRNVYGAAAVRCREGDIVIDAVEGNVTVRNDSGDVRIIALEGVGGDYDVLAERGNVRMVLPPTADATLLVSAEGGTVHSGVPLTGTTQRGLQKFQARLKEGRYTIGLETKGGDITID